MNLFPDTRSAGEERGQAAEALGIFTGPFWSATSDKSSFFDDDTEFDYYAHLYGGETAAQLLFTHETMDDTSASGKRLPPDQAAAA